MNLFDLGAIALIFAAIMLGFRSGALPQIGGLAGAIGGGAVALAILPFVAGPLAVLEPHVKAFTVIIGLLLFVGFGEAIGSTLGRAVANQIGTGVLGALDRVGGAFVGAIQAILIIWLAGGLLAVGSFDRLSSEARASATVRTLHAVLPDPAEIAGELERLIDASGLPDVFVGIGPPAAPSVDRPADPEARRIARAAEASTVRVSALTCGLQSSGTGFVIRPGYVVTSAHVVAGGRTIRVAVGDQLADATPVLVDPAQDVALLYAPQLRAPALQLARSDPERGDDGATLGYPGGGPLRISPAAVAGVYEAEGRDVYGNARVTRDILELRAEIDQGDSGGPFILADGTVGGLVFAEARTDEEVGYALTPTSVSRLVSSALGRTGLVSTGACIR